MPPAAVTADNGSKLTITADLPTAEVWPWFTDADLLVRWWPDEAETDVREGGAFRLSWPSWVLGGTYTRVEPPRRLAFTWSWDHDDLEPRNVEITLEPVDSSTRVTIDHDYGTEDERDGYRDGWLHFLGKLAEVAA